MRAAAGGDGDFAQAFGALFRGGRCRRRRIARLDAGEQPVQRHHDAEIDDAGNDQEGDYMVEKVTDLEFALADVKGDVTEIRLAASCRNERVEHNAYHRTHDL